VTRISRLLLVFSLAYGFFMVLPAFLVQPMPGVPLLKRGDVLDLLTPIVLLPLYYLLYLHSDRRGLTAKEGVMFAAVGAAWAEGQGLHLASNTIRHFLLGEDTSVAALAYLLDEVASHHIWHLAVLGMSILIAVRAWRAPPSEERIQWAPVVIAAAIYGFTCFLNFVEGQTAHFAIPIMAIIAFAILARRRHFFAVYPILAFFAVAYMVALLFCAGWAVYWGGLPEFSEVGII